MKCKSQPDAAPLTLVLVFALALTACSEKPPLGPHGPAAPATQEQALARVAAVHGAPGPFAVAGFRLGERALRELGLAHGAFDIDVVHQSPSEVQWSCIADGLQAATGASAGKLNLHVEAVPLAQMRTVVRRKSTGQELIFRLRDSFAQRFVNRPRAGLAAAGSEVLQLRDDDIFIVETVAQPLPGSTAPNPADAPR